MTTTTSAWSQPKAACGTVVTRDNLTSCAMSASLLVQSQRQAVRAAEARELAVSPLLPSNPVASFSAARRTTNALSATNWYASLAQELEVAGQRGRRRDAAAAEVNAESKRLVLAAREVATTAWSAFFEVIAGREQQRLIARLVQATGSLATAARARADQGLAAPMDADVADAAAVRVVQLELATERRVAEATAALSSLLGFDPEAQPITVEGALVPLDEAKRALPRIALEAPRVRPEVLALDAARRSFELRASAYERARIPNPTLLLFAQNDGWSEHVFGAGLSIPIPLPGNVGRTYLGEIAEAKALAERTSIERERMQREIRLEIATAARDFESFAQEVAAFSPERLARAEQDLRSLGQAVEAGQLGVREAVMAQQTFIELLEANITARRAYCLASVNLAHALGVPLEQEAP